MEEPIVEGKGVEWGWTLDGLGVICIFWYTLRNKKRFLRCCAHEASHIIDYENQFSPEERKVIKIYLHLESEYRLNLEKDKEETERLWTELEFYRQIYKELIGKWIKWDTMTQNEHHERAEWYDSYSKLYKSFLNSPWEEYAYRNWDPLPHEYFIKDENGKLNS